jgi:subtilisin family serine protease
MKHTSSKWMLAAVSAAALTALVAILSTRARAQQSPDIADTALEQISEIAAIKDAFSPAQQKIEAGLVFALKKANGDLTFTSVSDVPETLDPVSNVTVDIYGTVSQSMLDAIASANGVVLNESDDLGVVQASVPLGALEAVAANDDVRSIQSAAQAVLNAGSLTSQGYISHRANNVAAMGITGAGITVGVLSDSAHAARIAALVSSGDLPPGTSVLTGQAGPSNGADEGTAMMEIVHDIAPGANLIFATAFNSVASFASNILALQAAGAKVIVDDVSYFNEGVFQDGPIARAVNQATANGAIYFSSAANSGSLTFGTSGTWEGDFSPNGPVGPPISGTGETGTVHNFGTAGSPQNYNSLTKTSTFISLKWSDPLGASTNDYDLFILNSTGTTVKGFSASAQTGTQDPYEFVSQSSTCSSPTPSGYCAAVGDRIVVVLHSGATRALHIDTERGQLSIGTAGATVGHNAGASTVSMAATYWNSAKTGTRPFLGFVNPNEPFSSDGPRKIFFNPNGTPITPGNLLFATNGGTTLQKPDLAAADGNSVRTPGFTPFFGTSAAAPHAAGIAALVLSVQPTWTPAQVLNAMTSTALDSMAPGIDRDSGNGIVMALPAVQYALTH